MACCVVCRLSVQKLLEMINDNIFFALVVIGGVAAYFYLRRVFSYWDRIGVESVAPSFPFGNLGKNVMQKLSIGQLAAEFYKNGSGRFIGIYSCFRPTLILRDPGLIRNICGRDFKYFYHRGFHFDEKNDPMAANVLIANGERWKNLREKLSPAFTSGKLKGMFDTIKACSKSVIEYTDQFADTGEPVEVREVFARYATNIIASIAFGIDIDCIKNPKDEFRRHGMMFFDTNLRNTVRQFLSIGSPSLSTLFRIRSTDVAVQNFMTAIVKQNAEYREQNNISRRDFFQLLMDLHRSGSVQLDDEWKTIISNDSHKPLTLNEITAQALIFFAASFETTSSTMSFCLYELAKNTEIQRKVQAEIDASGELTYESVEKMKYLESCVDETLRKHSPVTVVTRECTENYKIPESDVVIEKGTQIFIPVYGIHRDEKYYPEPEKFDPNRFSVENSAGKTFLDRPYIPFGSGQRLCMGLRLGKLQVKIGLISMLQNYNFTLGAEYLKKDIELSPKTVINTPKFGLPLLASKRVP